MKDRKIDTRRAEFTKIDIFLEHSWILYNTYKNTYKKIFDISKLNF